MSDNELCYMTADEAISAFKAKTLSPVELVDAVIDQSEKVNDTVNAFTYTFLMKPEQKLNLQKKITQMERKQEI